MIRDVSQKKGAFQSAHKWKLETTLTPICPSTFDIDSEFVTIKLVMPKPLTKDDS
jgi:hypothetical protein